MNQRTYTLKMTGDAVTMTVGDLIKLTEELQALGIDADIQPGSTPGVAVFKLKEGSSTQ